MVKSERKRKKLKEKGRSSIPGDPGALDAVIDAIETLRDLAGRIGDDNLRRLLDAL